MIKYLAGALGALLSVSPAMAQQDVQTVWCKKNMTTGEIQYSPSFLGAVKSWGATAEFLSWQNNHIPISQEPGWVQGACTVIVDASKNPRFNPYANQPPEPRSIPPTTRTH